MTVTVDAVVNFNVFDAALALCSVDDFWWERKILEIVETDTFIF